MHTGLLIEIDSCIWTIFLIIGVVWKDCDNSSLEYIFTTIIDIFGILLVKDENECDVFNNNYLAYVKENFSENKNFSKMIMVFDNIDYIFNASLPENELAEEELKQELIEKKKVKKKSKNNSSGLGEGLGEGLGSGPGADFMKGLLAREV